LPRLFAVIGWVVAGVRALITGFVVLAFVYMTLAVLTEVVGRYLFGFSIAAVAETATWAQIWMVLLGAGVAMRHNMHVAVDVLPQLLPLWPARLLKLVLAAGCVWFLAVVFVGSLPLLRIGQMQTSPILGWPMWIIYLALPIGAVYFAIEIVIDVARRWGEPFGSAPEAEGEGPA